MTSQLSSNNVVENAQKQINTDHKKKGKDTCTCNRRKNIGWGYRRFHWIKKHSRCCYSRKNWCKDRDKRDTKSWICFSRKKIVWYRTFGEFCHTDNDYTKYNNQKRKESLVYETIQASCSKYIFLNSIIFIIQLSMRNWHWAREKKMLLEVVSIFI